MPVVKLLKNKNINLSEFLLIEMGVFVVKDVYFEGESGKESDKFVLKIVLLTNLAKNVETYMTSCTLSYIKVNCTMQY